MDTSVDRARVGLAGAKTRHGLTEAKLRELHVRFASGGPGKGEGRRPFHLAAPNGVMQDPLTGCELVPSARSKR